MNTLIKTLIVLLLLSGHSWAANTLEINGVILESACAISPDNAYQVIDMNIITIKEIERNGRSKNHPLNIKLINCRLKNYKGEKNKLIEMTFFGLDTAQQSLKKKGLLLIIENNNGERVLPDVPHEIISFSEGVNNISYNIYIMKNSRKVIAANFSANITLMINYK